MTRTLYAVLNVAPDADPAVIEAAYKALMKKYHPDRLGGAHTGDERRAAEINEAFQILRDPNRRAHYDENARAKVDQLRRNAYAAPPPIYKTQASQRRGSRWPSLLLLLILGGALYYAWQETDGFQREVVSANPFSGRATASGASRAAVRIADVERAVAQFDTIRSKSGLLGLTAFSQDCFASQARSMSIAELDFCVAFDHAAAAYGARIAGDDLPQLPRFEPAELDIRHQSAARLVATDDQWINARLMQLRSMTEEHLKPADQRAQPRPSAEESLAPAAAGAAAVAGAVAARPLARPRRSAEVTRQYRRPRTAPQPARGTAKRDPDFLEREGYIY
jgi:curved DNA-binding protein CbpA